MGTQPGKVIIALEYESAGMSTPALLDLALEDPSAPNGVKYVTLVGKAAKKLSNLKAGALYYEPDEIKSDTDKESK